MELNQEQPTVQSPEQQVALNDIATPNDWSPEQIDLATNQLSPQGQETVQHVQEQMTKQDEDIKRGLGLTALSPEDQMALDSLAASGADQDRIDAAAAVMSANNK